MISLRLGLGLGLGLLGLRLGLGLLGLLGLGLGLLGLGLLRLGLGSHDAHIPWEGSPSPAVSGIVSFSERAALQLEILCGNMSDQRGPFRNPSCGNTSDAFKTSLHRFLASTLTSALTSTLTSTLTYTLTSTLGS